MSIEAEDIHIRWMEKMHISLEDAYEKVCGDLEHIKEVVKMNMSSVLCINECELWDELCMRRVY